MGRKPQADRLAEIYGAVEEHPGERPGFVARLLGLPRSSITRALPMMEEEGYLLSEDDRGRLWPYRKSEIFQ